MFKSEIIFVALSTLYFGVSLVKGAMAFITVGLPTCDEVSPVGETNSGIK